MVDMRVNILLTDMLMKVFGLYCVAKFCACENGGYCDHGGTPKKLLNFGGTCVCSNEYIGRYCQFEKGAQIVT